VSAEGPLHLPGQWTLQMRAVSVPCDLHWEGTLL
jgi:hypothetical protein